MINEYRQQKSDIACLYSAIHSHVKR